MKPVNIAGDYTPCRSLLLLATRRTDPMLSVSFTGAYKTAGTWTALIAGEENLGEIDAGNCMCTAGSSDIYKNVTWGQCDMSDPKWCEKDMGITVSRQSYVHAYIGFYTNVPFTLLVW
jgi:hypothetical protein